MAKVASSAAMTRSQAAARPQPPPIATPLTTAIVGHGQRRHALEHRAEAAVVARDRVVGLSGRGLHEREEAREIRAGAEMPAGAGDHQRARLEVRADALEQGDECLDQFVRKRVALVGTVQPGKPERAALLDLKQVAGRGGGCGHEGSPFRPLAGCP